MKFIANVLDSIEGERVGNSHEQFPFPPTVSNFPGDVFRLNFNALCRIVTADRRKQCLGLFPYGTIAMVRSQLFQRVTRLNRQKAWANSSGTIQCHQRTEQNSIRRACVDDYLFENWNCALSRFRQFSSRQISNLRIVGFEPLDKLLHPNLFGGIDCRQQTGQPVGWFPASRAENNSRIIKCVHYPFLTHASDDETVVSSVIFDIKVFTIEVFRHRYWKIPIYTTARGFAFRLTRCHGKPNRFAVELFVA